MDSTDKPDTAGWRALAPTVAGVLAVAIGLAAAAPAAAQSVGYATFTAVIAKNGPPWTGTGLWSSKKLKTGRYLVEFTREIKNCAVVAGVHGKAGGQVSTQSVAANPKQLLVNTRNNKGKAADFTFTVIVTCTS